MTNRPQALSRHLSSKVPSPFSRPTFPSTGLQPLGLRQLVLRLRCITFNIIGTSSLLSLKALRRLRRFSGDAHALGELLNQQPHLSSCQPWLNQRSPRMPARLQRLQKAHHRKLLPRNITIILRMELSTQMYSFSLDRIIRL